MDLANPQRSHAAISLGEQSCPSCSTTVYLGNGLCLNCLLRDAAGSEPFSSGPENSRSIGRT
jgi:hypothetical protein